MNKKIRLYLIISAILSLALGLQSCAPAANEGNGQTQNNAQENTRNEQPAEDRQACDIERENELAARAQRINAQLEEMTTEEKIGQMMISSVGNVYSSAAPPTVLDEESAALIRDKKLGGVIFFGYNISTEEQTKALIAEIKKVSRENSNIPLFFALDEEGGRVTRLPETMEKAPTAQSIGATGDAEKAYEAGRQIAANMRKLGFNLNFAPVCDINTNPNNPVIGDRAFSGDPQIAAEMASKFYRGLKEGGVLGAAKHFPGHGDTVTDSHLELPSVNTDAQTLKNRELVPFEAVIASEVDMVMTSHILVNSIDTEYPATLSTKVKEELLFNTLNYKGIVISDDLNMKAITDHYTMEEAAKLAINSGCDIVLVSHDIAKTRAISEYLVKAVEKNEISTERIDASVTKILMLKGELG